MWAVLHEVRSEFAQLMSCLFLLVAGPGPWSLDASYGWIAHNGRDVEPSAPHARLMSRRLG